MLFLQLGFGTDFCPFNQGTRNRGDEILHPCRGKDTVGTQDTLVQADIRCEESVPTQTSAPHEGSAPMGLPSTCPLDPRYRARLARHGCPAQPRPAWPQPVGRDSRASRWLTCPETQPSPGSSLRLSSKVVRGQEASQTQAGAGTHTLRAAMMVFPDAPALEPASSMAGGENGFPEAFRAMFTDLSYNMLKKPPLQPVPEPSRHFSHCLKGVARPKRLQ